MIQNITQLICLAWSCFILSLFFLFSLLHGLISVQLFILPFFISSIWVLFKSCPLDFCIYYTQNISTFSKDFFLWFLHISISFNKTGHFFCKPLNLSQKYWDLHIFILKIGDKSPMWKMSSLYQEKRHYFHQNKKLSLRKFCINRPF